MLTRPLARGRCKSSTRRIPCRFFFFRGYFNARGVKNKPMITALITSSARTLREEERMFHISNDPLVQAGEIFRNVFPVICD